MSTATGTNTPMTMAEMVGHTVSTAVTDLLSSPDHTLFSSHDREKLRTGGSQLAACGQQLASIQQGATPYAAMFGTFIASLVSSLLKKILGSNADILKGLASAVVQTSDLLKSTADHYQQQETDSENLIKEQSLEVVPLESRMERE